MIITLTPVILFTVVPSVKEVLTEIFEPSTVIWIKKVDALGEAAARPDIRHEYTGLSG